VRDDNVRLFLKRAMVFAAEVGAAQILLEEAESL
jgi:hypothetical protein